MNTFSWIDQSDLDAIISEMQQRVRRCEDNSVKNLIKNVIDPVQTAVIAWTTNGDETQVLRRMASSSAAQCMSMAIGWFHQTILANSPGWQLHDALYDIEHPQRRLLAEIKNKHNTMNASNQEKVIDDLNTALRQKRESDWRAYLVKIVPKTPERYQKQLSRSGRKVLYEVDGATFYEIATDDPNALHDVVDYLIDSIVATPDTRAWLQQKVTQSLPPRN